VIAFLRQRYPSKTPPSVAHYTRLWLTYGPEFLAATIERAPAWLDAAHRAEEAARLKAEIAAREARLAKLEEGA
jgi:hypothetical protein